eukprot:16438-Heterococcus_DN1.PRE.2
MGCSSSSSSCDCKCSQFGRSDTVSYSHQVRSITDDDLFPHNILFCYYPRHSSAHMIVLTCCWPWFKQDANVFHNVVLPHPAAPNSITLCRICVFS